MIEFVVLGVTLYHKEYQKETTLIKNDLKIWYNKLYQILYVKINISNWEPYILQYIYIYFILQYIGLPITYIYFHI